MITKLSELQNSIIPATVPYPNHPDQFQQQQQQQQTFSNEIVSPPFLGNRTFEQFLHTQQYQLHSGSSPSSQSSPSSPNNGKLYWLVMQFLTNLSI